MSDDDSVRFTLMIPKLSRPPLARMLKIHEALQRGSRPNCSSLAREFEVSVKTIQRDIEFMRDQLGLPIEYDQVQHAYGYTEEVAGFPAVQITEGELMALLVAGRAMEQYRGTPYENQLKAAFDKITAGLKNTISFTPGAGLAAVSFGSLGQSETDMKVFEALSKAVVNRREIEFDYRKPGSSQSVHRRVQPFHLAYRDNLCYLIGWDVEKKELRQYALPRMANAVVRTETFKAPADFSAEEYFRGTFGAQGGTGDYRVRIRFDSSAAFYIRERRWHPTQEMKDLPNGGIELSLRLADLEEVERWILSWGVHAVALEPSELVESIRTTAKRVNEQYLHPSP
jgi:proteasome accessory factor B